jgi:Asp/Glu/hydantoin racemase
MAQNPERTRQYTESVLEARKLLVEREKRLIRSLASSQDSEQVDGHIDLIRCVQKVMDVIDRLEEEPTSS